MSRPTVAYLDETTNILRVITPNRGRVVLRKKMTGNPSDNSIRNYLKRKGFATVGEFSAYPQGSQIEVQHSPETV